jgi:hypothetical protein
LSLQQFDKFDALTGNGNYINLLKFALKIREMTSCELILWRILVIWNLCAAASQSKEFDKNVVKDHDTTTTIVSILNS